MQIETNQPAPPRIKNMMDGKFRWYPFDKMAVAETMFFPNEPKGSRSDIAAHARGYAKHKSTAKRKVRFKTKSIDGGVRIQRLMDERLATANTAPVTRQPKAQRVLPQYPFKDMQVGDSITFTDAHRVVDCKAYTAAKVHAYRRRKAGDQCKFAASASPIGVRIWRVE